MSRRPHPNRNRLSAIVVSALVLASAPGLNAGVSAAKKNKKDRSATTTTVVVDEADTDTPKPKRPPRAPKTAPTTTTVPAPVELKIASADELQTEPDAATTDPAPVELKVASADQPQAEPVLAATVEAQPVLATSDATVTFDLNAAKFDYGTALLDAYNKLYASDRTTSLSEVVTQIGADTMWADGYTGAGIDVAVIDTGVAPIAELSTTNVFVGPDLSFEGSIDEVAGLDTYGHGTHIAGIIAGRTPGADPLDPGSDDFIGVAPDARIVSVKVADNTGAVDVSQVIAAIDWVVQNRQTNGLNIRVLNLSYNTSGTQSSVLDPLSKAVENAWNHGILVVVSAGNDGLGSFGLASPATNPHVLAVSSAELVPGLGWVNPLWAPSGDGTRNPDLLAPGVSIMSLRTPGSRVDTEYASARVDGDDRLFLGSGTSQSAAVVSGAAALLLQQRPELTPDQVKTLLRNSAADMFDLEIIRGSGVVNLAIAKDTKVGAASQHWEAATGLGSLEAARGDDHVGVGDDLLVGEYTVTGAAWDPEAWVAASENGTAWSGDDDWSGSSWSGSSWSGSSWSGSSWSGSSWSGSSWSGSSWSGSSWSGSSWSGSSWSGSSWSGSSWSGSSWSGSSWSGSSWSGSSWSGSSWSGSSWSGSSWS